MFVVMTMRKWDDFEPNMPISPILGGVKGPKGSCGFLVVYESREAAIAVEGADVRLAEIAASAEARDA